MGIEILVSLLGGLASLAAGFTVSTEFVQKLIQWLSGTKREPQKPYADKLSELTTSLISASKQVDLVLAELGDVARHREAAVQKLETDLAGLEDREKQLKKRIEDLENVPIPVAEHFARLLEAGEKRSAWRDYALFGAGVVVSTVIAIGLKLVGLG